MFQLTFENSIKDETDPKVFNVFIYRMLVVIVVDSLWMHKKGTN